MTAGRQLDTLPLMNDTLTELAIVAVMPLGGQRLLLTLSDGTVVQRDLSPMFEDGEDGQADAGWFGQVRVAAGILVWPGDIGVKSEPLLWGGYWDHGPEDAPLGNALAKPNGTLVPLPSAIEDGAILPDAARTIALADIDAMELRAHGALQSPELAAPAELAQDLLALASALRACVAALDGGGRLSSESIVGAPDEATGRDGGALDDD